MKKVLLDRPRQLAAANLRKRRIGLLLSCQNVADRLNISLEEYADLDAGISRVPLSVYESIATQLDIPKAKLYSVDIGVKHRPSEVKPSAWFKEQRLRADLSKLDLAKVIEQDEKLITDIENDRIEISLRIAARISMVLPIRIIDLINKRNCVIPEDLRYDLLEENRRYNGNWLRVYREFENLDKLDVARIVNRPPHFVADWEYHNSQLPEWVVRKLPPLSDSGRDFRDALALLETGLKINHGWFIILRESREMSIAEVARAVQTWQPAIRRLEEGGALRPLYFAVKVCRLFDFKPTELVKLVNPAAFANHYDGRWLKVYKSEFKLSTAEFAAKLGISSGDYIKYADGNKVLKYKHAIRFASRLSLKPQDFQKKLPKDILSDIEMVHRFDVHQKRQYSAGMRVRKHRVGRLMPVESVAVALNITVEEYSDMEAGLHGFTQSDYERTTELLGIPITILFEEDYVVEQKPLELSGGEWLRKKRMETKISTPTLAQAIGKDELFITDFEAGNADISLEDAGKISIVVPVQIRDLIHLNQSNVPEEMWFDILEDERKYNGIWLQVVRDFAGVSGEYVSDLIGKSNGYVSQIEKENTVLRGWMVKKLCTLTDTTSPDFNAALALKSSGKPIHFQWISIYREKKGLSQRQMAVQVPMPLGVLKYLTNGEVRRPLFYATQAAHFLNFNLSDLTAPLPVSSQHSSNPPDFAEFLKLNEGDVKVHELIKYFIEKRRVSKHRVQKALQVSKHLFLEILAGTAQLSQVQSHRLGDFFGVDKTVFLYKTEEIRDNETGALRPYKLLSYLITENRDAHNAIARTINTTRHMFEKILSGKRKITLDQASVLGLRYNVDRDRFLIGVELARSKAAKERMSSENASGPIEPPIAIKQKREIKQVFHKKVDITIANRLKDLREKFGYTQDYAAQLLEISSHTYGKIERGETLPPVQLLIKAQRVYDVPFSHFEHGALYTPWRPNTTPFIIDGTNSYRPYKHSSEGK